MIHYLEVVSHDVPGVCLAYAAAQGLEFSAPVPTLGGARLASLSNGSLLGVRAPLRDSEAPVVRPYWRVDDLDAALKAVASAGGQLALPPMPLPGYGTIAIYLLGGNDHGLWQP